MQAQAGAAVVELSAVRAGEAQAARLEEVVAARAELKDHHLAHAIYVHAQNQLAMMSEQLTQLRELAPIARVLAAVEDEFVPSGPPMSPLTTSFFTSWALFDVGAGAARETLATVAMAVGAAGGMHAELVRVMGLMQASHMAVYRHEGEDGDALLLRDLVTERRCRAICPSGYRGRAGELWYVRVLPPPLPARDEHVVFTTPYVLIDPGEAQWRAYFDRHLPGGSNDVRLAAYERHMKWGPSPAYWSEFVFEAYVNHRHDTIYLKGLPDVPTSRPHHMG